MYNIFTCFFCVVRKQATTLCLCWQLPSIFPSFMRVSKMVPSSLEKMLDQGKMARHTRKHSHSLVLHCVRCAFPQYTDASYPIRLKTNMSWWSQLLNIENQQNGRAPQPYLKSLKSGIGFSFYNESERSFCYSTSSSILCRSKQRLFNVGSHRTFRSLPFPSEMKKKN